jgi:ABC-type multidrug transport system fused ATPase/permease subunit
MNKLAVLVEKKEFAKLIFETLNKKEKFSLLRVTLMQIFTNFLDLIGVVCAGYFATSAIQVSKSMPITGTSSFAFESLQLDTLSEKNLLFVIGFMVVFFLVTKTIISIIITRRILFFFSIHGTKITIHLINKLMKNSLENLRKKNIEENVYALTYGADALALGVFASSVIVLADLTLLATLFIGLFIISFSSAISLFGFFGLVGLFLFVLLNNRAKGIGNQYVKETTQSTSQITDLLNSFREVIVSNVTSFYVSQISLKRHSLANLKGEFNFMPYIGKYVIEISIIVGGLLLIATQVAFGDSVTAAGSIAIFIAASSRIAPAVLRIQQNLITIRSNVEIAKTALERLLTEQTMTIEKVNRVSKKSRFESNVTFKNVHFKYKSSQEKILTDTTFEVRPGEFFGIVGPSGAGKSTLVDLMLGIQKPNAGTILISGEAPLTTFIQWPGQVAYVPQQPFILNLPLSENIFLGKEHSEVEPEQLAYLLKVCSLESLVKNLEDGVLHVLKDNGHELSGGERQRIGLARALATEPSLLILDEATSALDATTERHILANLKERQKQIMTMIMISHRISAVEPADRILYLERGKSVEVDTFEKLKTKSLNFSNQVRNSGL